MAINIPWSTFGFESEEEKRLRLASEQQERIGGLLGQSAKPAVTGQLGRFGVPLMPAQEGSGYYGSNMGVEAQTNLLTQAQAMGYTPQQAQSLLQPTQNAQTKQASLDQFMLGKQFDAPSKQLENVNKLRMPYEKAVAAPRKAIDNYNSAVDLMQNAKFAEGNMLTGAESVALTKKYLKQILPDESVMGDDIATLLKAQGLPEYAKSFLQSIVGSGTMSRTGATEVMQAMATMAESSSRDRDIAREQYGTEARTYNLPTTFMGERRKIQDNPLTTPPTGFVRD